MYSKIRSKLTNYVTFPNHIRVIQKRPLKSDTIGKIGNEVKNPEKDLNNKNRKEVNIMASTKKADTKITTTEVNIEPTKKEEPTPREIISQYAEAYDSMTKVFGLLSPEHRMSIAAHLDQIVEFLEIYIGK